MPTGWLVKAHKPGEWSFEASGLEAFAAETLKTADEVFTRLPKADRQKVIRIIQGETLDEYNGELLTISKLHL